MKKTYQYKICVSGSAVADESAVKEKAKALGRAIAENDAILLTGATTGYPYLSAIGTKEAGGMVIGFSPGMGYKEHSKKYRLPTDYHDLIVYTGFGYSGRNLFLIRSSDAVIHIAGRIGTLNEFTSAFEDRKVIGVLLGTGGTSALIDDIIDIAERGPGKVVYDDDPDILIAKVMKLLRKEDL
ncbi:MAG: hypothetical protein CEO22_241 [Candidatus Berkelbacteria bacterium Gr01-1014_85]|uniref:Rossmann fold nucleotide-binding protein n=1 Tax=Candidatus Berkelbacteria bacterium Gr01-1014_85 TaxID=2017150 RepID=A0A554JCQ2_9BACT|nr:MAG: hypothetical protein CEO22_241 [Candidatus Berkelbacteria bacterium Gr01-1014_85]